MEKGTARLLVFLMFYIFYLCIGSLIFATIEQPIEVNEISDLNKLRREFLNSNQCVDTEQLEKYILHVIAATKNGIKLVNNATTVPNWNFASAFLFSGTLITTIGYGDIAPLSRSGKVFAMFFALFGIPMTAILLTAIVERLLRVVVFIEKSLEERFFAERGFSKSACRVLNIFVLIIAIVMGIIFIPALLFYFTEDWDYFEALYFCFITLTTIGLGDYTPGDGEGWIDNKYRPFYKIACVLYFLIGLSFAILVLEMCVKLPEDHPGMLFNCHKPVLDTGTELEPISSTPIPNHIRNGNKNRSGNNPKDYEPIVNEESEPAAP